MSPLVIGIIILSVWGAGSLVLLPYPAIFKGEKANDEWHSMSMLWPFIIAFFIGSHLYDLVRVPFIKLDAFETRIANRTKQKKLATQNQAIDIKVEEPKQLAENNSYREMNCKECGHIIKQ